MKDYKARDRKRRKARYGMRVSGRSIITIQQNLARKRKKAKRNEGV